MLLGYIHTWSTVHQAIQQGANTVISEFEQDIVALWREPKQALKITWPITMLIGQV